MALLSLSKLRNRTRSSCRPAVVMRQRWKLEWVDFFGGERLLIRFQPLADDKTKTAAYLNLMQATEKAAAALRSALAGRRSLGMVEHEIISRTNPLAGPKDVGERAD